MTSKKKNKISPIPAILVFDVQRSGRKNILQHNKKNKISEIMISIVPIIISIIALRISWLSYNNSVERSDYDLSPKLSVISMIKSMTCEISDENQPSNYINLICNGQIELYNSGGMKSTVSSLESIIKMGAIHLVVSHSE